METETEDKCKTQRREKRGHYLTRREEKDQKTGKRREKENLDTWRQGTR